MLTFFKQALESDVGFDLNGDGGLDDAIAYDPEAHPEINGYYVAYLDLYLAEFTENLQWYLDNLNHAEDWTWFDEDGSALTEAEVGAMTSADKVQAVLEGRYAGGSGGMGEMPGGGQPGGSTELIVGAPDSGATQSNTGSMDSANDKTYEEMVAAYQADITGVEAGDRYGNNIVALYNPLNDIGDGETDDPTWTRIVMGASEGGMSLFSSLDLQLAWLSAGVDADIEWQWNGGHVPSEILGDFFSLNVDQMYGAYVVGETAIVKPEAEPQTANGTASEAAGRDITAWVTLDSSGAASFTLADIAAYRTSGASKAMRGFDVIDYGQEDYAFGDREQDARHWDAYLLELFETYADVLAPLFNGGSGA